MCNQRGTINAASFVVNRGNHRGTNNVTMGKYTGCCKVPAAITGAATSNTHLQCGTARSKAPGKSRCNNGKRTIRAKVSKIQAMEGIQ